MRPLSLRLLLAFALVALPLVAFTQTRNLGTVDANDARILSTQLVGLPDGGCALNVCGELVSGDVAVLAGCEQFELAASVNRTRCTSLMDTARTRWLKRAGFLVDAGVP